MAAVSSPCIQVCVLDAAGLCLGCGRTLDEIARWGAMAEAERLAVMARLAESRPIAAASPKPIRAGDLT